MAGTQPVPITLCLKNFPLSVVCRYQKTFFVEIKFRAMYTLPRWYYVIVFYMTFHHFGLVFFVRNGIISRVSCVNTYILYRRLHFTMKFHLQFNFIRLIISKLRHFVV